MRATRRANDLPVPGDGLPTRPQRTPKSADESRMGANARLHGQGIAFSLAAILVAASSVLLERPERWVELAAVAVAVALFGVPHGGLDTVFARQLHGLRGLRDWSLFVALYSLLAAAVVGVWLIAPTVFLLGFLLISAVHFSGDPQAGSHRVSRALYGGAVIVLPAGLHGAEVGELFGLLAGTGAAGLVTPVLEALALPWLAALAMAAVAEAGRSPRTSLEFLAVGALMFLAPPLTAFAVFFCGMHSARHILRTFDWAARQGRWPMMASGLLPTLAVMVGGAAIWWWRDDVPFDAQVVQLVFVGLAALTVPHMALVERVRFSGWRLRRGDADG